MNPTQEQTRPSTGWAPAPGSVARHNWPCSLRWAWWLAHRPLLVALVALAVLVGVEAGPVVLAVALAWCGGAGGVVAGASGHVPPRRGPVLLGLWRSFWAYGVRWRTAMMLSGLGGRFNGDEYVPRVVRVRAGRYADRVTVRMVVGQQPEDWSRRLDALAHGFGARSCPGASSSPPARLPPTHRRAPRPPRPHGHPSCPAAVDLGAVPVGRREDGQPWTVRLRVPHPHRRGNRCGQGRRCSGR